MSKISIVVAEDEADIRDLIHFNLFKENFEVSLAEDGEAALKLILEKKPDIALLDIMMPKKDGISLCQEIRASKEVDNMGLIMLTAKGTEEDIVRGLEVGADDYITKPFSPKVLLARIQAVIRRKGPNTNKNNKLLNAFGLKIEIDRRKAYNNEIEMDLTYTEFQLLVLLISNPGLVYTRAQIVDTIRGENHAITDRSVDVQVVGLRKKLGEKGEFIETVRGVGYRFKDY